MYVGLLQIECVNDKRDNLRKLEFYLSKFLNKAELVVVPEYFMYFSIDMFSNRNIVEEVAESINGEFIENIKNICREYCINILTTILEKCSDGVYNSAILVNKHGEVLLKYRKIHLFDAYGYSESGVFKRGSIPCRVVSISDFNVACAICFDIRFPELFRVYAIEGADVVLIPAAWFRGDLKEETLRFLAQARAHENGMYVVVCNQYSKYFTGRSMVVNPWGIVELDLGIGEKYVEHRLDKSTVEHFRNAVPVLRIRRTLSYTRTIL